MKLSDFCIQKKKKKAGGYVTAAWVTRGCNTWAERGPEEFTACL